MRRAFLRLQRRPTNSQCLDPRNRIDSSCLSRASFRNIEHLQCRVLHKAARSFQADFRAAGYVPFAGDSPGYEPIKDDKFTTSRGDLPRIAAERVKDPSAWIELLQPYLPLKLRLPRQQHQPMTEPSWCEADKEAACTNILLLLNSARKRQHAGVELLAHMVHLGQKNAAIYLMKMLLDDLAARNTSRTRPALPSNILWPAETLKDLCKKPIQPLTVTNTSGRHLTDLRSEIDPRYSSILSEHKETTMTQIWPTLGSLIIQSADLEGNQAETVMNVVLLILGHIHNLDLVPENVYSDRLSPLSTTLQKPPVLHLVSSRMLTALSDATWREHQDEMIRKAVSHGVSYEDIGRDPPGGRFRLKVRPLGAEVWLEFVLWCCVEGGFASAGARIVRQLHAQVDNPWYAVTWSSSSGRSHINSAIDWNRISARYGTSVGLREGYSGDRPLVEMPVRTVSTEVILGLIEAGINTVKFGDAHGTSTQIVQRNIVSVIKFLEPHDLPPSYLNYLAVRLIQADAFDLPQYASNLYTWYKDLHLLKSLQSTRIQRTCNVAFDLDTLSTHSELFAGILHQSIDGFVQLGDIHRALSAFNDLQELVDASKLQSIGSFLNQKAKPDTTEFFFSKPYQPSTQLQDFVGSHGQLPTYKLSGILDLASDTGLIGFVRWLLYNDDPDGPLIPQSAYQSPGLAGTLLRFASLSKDESLVTKVLEIQKTGKRLPTVRFLRALLNTDIAALNFRSWHGILSQLANVKGGGVGLTNIVQLAVTILKLENSKLRSIDGVPRGRALDQARRVLVSVLRGKYDERSGTYSKKVRGEYRQQLGSLLRVFRNYPESSLSSFAAQHSSRFPPTNLPQLAPSLFNMFMENAIQCKGAEEGVRLWEQFCQSSLSGNATTKANSVIEDFTTFGRNPEDEWRNTFHHNGDQAALLLRKASINSDDENQLRRMASHGFFPESHRQITEPNKLLSDALVIPNQRTLRLIIRSAVQERREILSQHGRPEQQDEILRWAAHQLEKFGVSKRMISMELEESTKQAGIRELDKRQLQSDFMQTVSTPVVRRVQSLFGAKAH